jgi:hypothetical protein
MSFDKIYSNVFSGWSYQNGTYKISFLKYQIEYIFLDSQEEKYVNILFLHQL